MKKISTFVLSGALGAMGALSASAEVVQKIQIDGNERIEDQTVFSYLDIKEGEDYNPRSGSDMIKKLYKTGLFSHVEMDWDGSYLTIRVEENPQVNEVRFEGNDELDSNTLKDAVSLRSRAVFTPDKVQRDITEIQAYYRQSGYFLAAVTPQVIERDQNRVDVIYVIDEGEKTNIGSIRFVGNNRFSDGDLKTIVRTKESAWWRLFSSADVYDPQRLEVDKELLRRHYIRSGYADFRVVSAVAELSKDKKDFFITFTVSEGKPYNFGKVDVRLDAVDDEDLNRDELLSVVTVQEGARYNGALVEENIDTLTEYLGSKGFAFLEVRPSFDQSEAEQTVDVSYNVVPGPRVYVNRINIKGNTRTRENVVRREMRFAEGDAFSSSKLERSKDRLTYLGFFENVDIEHKETGMPDRVDLDVSVKEQSTGEFNVGAGFSSYEGALATADIRERNFLGKGQDTSLAFTVSERRQNFNFSFTEPYLFGQELAGGIDLYNERQEFQDESSYDTGRTGGALRLGLPINEYMKDSISFGFKETKIDNVGSDASIFIQEAEGKRNSLFVANTFAIDTRDSYITPTHGSRVALTTEYSGFGTNTNYVKGTVNGSWHKELKDDFVLSLGSSVGALWDIEGDLPIFENYRAGGNSIRGFDFGGIGPRDTSTGDALGGKYLLTNSAELSFPLGTQMKEAGVHGLMFMDGGLVTGFDSHPQVVDSKIYRVSVGTGIYWRSPLGPLRFEFAVPVIKATEDKTRVFSFNFGTRF